MGGWEEDVPSLFSKGLQVVPLMRMVRRTIPRKVGGWVDKWMDRWVGGWMASFWFTVYVDGWVGGEEEDVPAIRKEMRARVSSAMPSSWLTAMERVKETAPRSPPQDNSTACFQEIP